MGHYYLQKIFQYGQEKNQRFIKYWKFRYCIEDMSQVFIIKQCQQQFLKLRKTGIIKYGSGNIRLIIKLNQIKYSALEVQYQLKSDHKISVSRTQLYRSFVKLNMKYGRYQDIHELSTENKFKMLNYCQEYAKNDLTQMIFSDESIFSLTDHNVSCWFSQGQSKHIPSKQVSYKQRQIHIWGAISYHSKTKLFIHTYNVNSEQYIKCLNEVFIPYVHENFKRKKYTLLQDGATSHVSKASKQFFIDNQINITKNPPWSPDLNTIQLIWAWMKKEFIKIRLNTKIETGQQIIEAVAQIWDRLDQEHIKNMINHTKSKMNKVIELNGEYEI